MCSLVCVSNLKCAIVFSDDMNWNALEWDRAAEELTWERVRTVTVTCPLNPKMFFEVGIFTYEHKFHI